MTRRVVITGMGALACNGNSVDELWDAIKNGRHGIGPTQNVDVSEQAVKFSGEVKLDNVELAGGDKRKMRRKDRFVLLSLYAAAEAMKDSGLDYENWANPYRTGVVVGSGIGGLASIEQEHATCLERGPSRVSPLLVPKMIVDSAAGDISIVYNAKGPNYDITTACATGTHCIGASFHHIRSGLCDVMITGGTEAPITTLGISGFANMKALSRRNDDHNTASRPFDAERDGFVIGEGAGILVLEELEHAKARGAKIHAEVVGYACTGDAFHETQPAPGGEAGQMAMRMAVEEAGINTDQMGYINAHGTSTPFNDKTETAIIKAVFGDHAKKLQVSSTKSMTGHTLGAAGGIEAVISAAALRDGILPPTINLNNPDPECDLDYIPHTAREAQVEYALSNNLGFGGHNASIVLKRFTG